MQLTLYLNKKIVKTVENSKMLYLRFLIYEVVCKISAEIKISEINGDENICLCGFSHGYDGRDAASCQG